MKIYLAGPMTGIKDLNYPAFNAEAARLRGLGYSVENPAENPECDSWEGYMRLAIAQLITSDAIALLTGWADSRGATIERALAQDLKMEILYAQDLREACEAA